jgi:endonuclease YncB( thermonuclease family)
MKYVLLLLTLLNLKLGLAQENDYLVIKGSFVIVDKSPDGDSVRFRPDNDTLWKQLKRSYRIDPSKDGTVQLRFEAIDAPELHYQGKGQPMGREARDFLLNELGFSAYIYNDNDTITDSVPGEIRGGILSNSAETNGRPISYVFLESDLASYQDGKRITLDDALLAKSLNTKVLQAGMAYYTVYSSQSETQRTYMRAIAQQAKDAGLGVWAVDKTTEFTLNNADDITQHQLILPKLFRRCTVYLRDTEKGFSGTFQEWLLADPSRDDEILLGGRKTRLSSVIESNGTTVSVLFDPLEAVFLEK